MIVFYDSYCKLCTRTAAVWKKLDWRKKLVFQSFRDLPDYPSAMEKEMHVKHADKWYKGFPAVLIISRTLPAIWPISPFLYIAKWLGLGNIIYRKIANNRTLLPVGKCENGACELPSPPHK